MSTPQPPARHSSSRRSAIRLLGAGSLATTGLLSAAAGARATPGGDPTPTSGPGQAPGGLPSLRSYAEHLKALADRGEFSGTVLFAHRGRTVFSRSYGMANKEEAIPNTRDTVFALASASKPFTGVALLQLAQRGKLRLWEKLGTYLSGFPSQIADHVTLHQLLTHTSGMGDLNENKEYAKAVPTWDTADEVVQGTLDFIKKAPLHFAPGTGSRYSNNGYHVLGSVIAEVSGQSFYDYMAEHVFEPAGMASSGFFTRTQWLSDPRIAQPYWLSGQRERINALREPDKLGDFPNAARLFIGSAGGNGFSTAPDLIRFSRALHNHRLLNPAFTELYWTAKAPAPPRDQNPDGGGHRPPRPGTPTASGEREQDPRPPSPGHSFHGYGAPLALYNNHWLFGHGGGAAGESTHWSIYRGLGWTTVVLANHDGWDLQGLIDRERSVIAGDRE